MNPLISKFITKLEKDGLLITLIRTKNFVLSEFSYYYLRRHPIYLFFIKIKIIIMRRLGSDDVTDADPFKIIPVDPKSIDSEVIDRFQYDWGVVSENSCDTRPVKERKKYKQLESHFVHENQKIFDEYVELIYESLKTKGYIPQKNLRTIVDYVPFYKRELEIAVYIDSNGEFYWIGYGQHRLLISRILNLDRVYVQVRVRHKNWQDIRDEIRTANSIEELSDKSHEYIDHPDIKDLRQALLD